MTRVTMAELATKRQRMLKKIAMEKKGNLKVEVFHRKKVRITG